MNKWQVQYSPAFITFTSSLRNIKEDNISVSFEILLVGMNEGVVLHHF